MELFYQVFDKGTLEDGEGVVVDFKNTIILLTCNLGAETIMQSCGNTQVWPAGDVLVERLRPVLLSHFKPALLGRLVIVPYYPLRDSALQDIVRLKLARIQRRFADNHRAALTYDASLVTAITARCTEVESGARNVDHILTQTLLPELAAVVLERLALGKPCNSVHVSCDDRSSFVYHVQP
jgi:type VI secretion system protein VasG